jgi:DNA-directed RNA polymerase subunit RPC12/RpoP
MDSYLTDFPECPYCRHEHKDAWEWDFGPGLEGEETFECDNCGKEMFVCRRVTIEYLTYETKSKK